MVLMPRSTPPSDVRTPRRRPRALVSAAVGVSLLLTALAPVPVALAAAPVVPSNGLLAEYVFDETAGSTVTNSAATAVGPATVMNGTNALWTGSSLVFSGGAKTSSTASWVRLPDAILSGKSSATVTIETKFDASMKSSFHFLWNIGNDATTQYYFSSVRDNPRTAITINGGGAEVNARSASALNASQWYSLTSVIDGAAGNITYYVDGVQVAKTPTNLTPASVTDQSLNTIGRAPWPDPMYKGEVSTFRVYDRALTAGEVKDVSEADASIHAASHQAAAQALLAGVDDVTIDESITTLPSYGGRVSWSSSDSSLGVGADGVTVTADQPAAGEPAVTTTLTATASVRGQSSTRSVPVTVQPEALPTDGFGYALVHFLEDSAGYAEKIYLDISRGDNPEQWDPLNGGNPVLASNAGSTGVRDPYLTYNPENDTYYIIATDLRVFGGDAGTGSCTTWCHWTTKASTKLNVWESKDLVTWSDLRQFDVAMDNGVEQAELGMAWAPEATWVDDYYPDGRGAFVVYWASTVFTNPEHTGATYSKILWGATPDFTQETYDFGGTFIDTGGNTIDTTIIQDDGKTYRITKDNSTGKGIYMESTPAAEWWKPAAVWTQIQTQIGASYSGGNPGGVEGPAVFKRHDEDKWYLYVDVIPSTGYRPLQTTDLDAGFTVLNSDEFYMAPHTKHGGIVSLTKSEYDAVRDADASSAVTGDLGSVEIESGADAEAVETALPAAADVNLAYSRGVADQPIDWDVSNVNTSVAGTYEVTGTVRTIGANLNQWVGDGGSTAYNAPNRVLYSSTAITVTAEVVVDAPAAVLPVTVSAETRCVASKVVLTVKATNDGTAPVRLVVETAYGSKTVATLAAGKSVASAFTTRVTTIPGGTASVTATAGAEQSVTSGAYAAATCG